MNEHSRPIYLGQATVLTGILLFASCRNRHTFSQVSLAAEGDARSSVLLLCALGWWLLLLSSTVWAGVFPLA